MAKKQAARRRSTIERDLSDALDRVDSLVKRQRWSEAATLLDDLNRRYPQRREILQRFVEAAVHLDDAHIYQYACEMLYRLCPQDANLVYMLTVAYLHNHWLALAQTMGRAALERDPAHEKAAQVRKMLDEIEPLIAMETARLELTGPDSRECLIRHEQVRSLLAQGRFVKAHEVAEELIKRRPTFSPAYNNGAEAYYHDGRLPQAISLSERLLAFEPDDVFALCNLVRFTCVAGKVEEAARYAERLKEQKPATSSSAVKQAEAIAWLGDDAGVLRLFEEGRHLPADIPQDQALLYHLAAVACFRQGREDEAHGYWQSALSAAPHFQLARGNLDDLKLPVADRNAPWSYTMAHFVPKKLLSGLLAKFKERRGEDTMREYLEVHPELEGLVPVLLDRGDRVARELALQLAEMFHAPAMLRAVRDFALGQRGADQLRVKAARIADEAGLLPGGPKRLWLNGAWCAGSVQRCEIHSDPIERSHAPGVFDLIMEGVNTLKGGDPERAERLLRRALAIDPNDPVAMNNLALVCAQLGREDEAEALSVRLHARHPDYLFGRTALASLAVSRGQLDRARELLAPLDKRTRLHVSEFAALCMVKINLHLAAGEHQQARTRLDMWRQAMPEHPSLGHFERLVTAGIVEVQAGCRV